MQPPDLNAVYCARCRCTCCLAAAISAQQGKQQVPPEAGRRAQRSPTAPQPPARASPPPPRLSSLPPRHPAGYGNWYDAPLPLVQGGQATYFGASVPFDLGTLAAIEFAAMAGAESFRGAAEPEKRVYPGGAFDPMGMVRGRGEAWGSCGWGGVAMGVRGCAAATAGAAARTSSGRRGGTPVRRVMLFLLSCID